MYLWFSYTARRGGGPKIIKARVIQRKKERPRDLGRLFWAGGSKRFQDGELSGGGPRMDFPVQSQVSTSFGLLKPVEYRDVELSRT